MCDCCIHHVHCDVIYWLLRFDKMLASYGVYNGYKNGRIIDV